LIRSVGMHVETFPSAQAFLEAPAADRPSCLILDLRLPGASGLELQTALGDAGRILPIIFISGVATVPASVRAMKGGALDFLQKPFDEAELLDRVRQALSRSHAARTEHAHRAAIQRRLGSLTPRERQVLDLVVTGKLNKQIAAELGAAEKTVKIHRGRVMRKMAAESVAELVRMVQRVDQESSLALAPALPDTRPEGKNERKSRKEA
jgi:two-component system, LuxR family, response regulator FixJ